MSGTAEILQNRPQSPLIFVPFIVLPNLLLSVLVALRPKVQWRLPAFAIFAYINLRGSSFTSGDPMQDYTIGCAFMCQVFTAVQLLWLTNPLSEFRHELDQVSPQSLPLWRRVYWAMCVHHSPRGIGWNYQVSKLPPCPTESRWAFVRSRLVKAIGFFLLVDLSQSYIHSNPLFSLTGDDALSITSQGYILRCVNIVAWFAIPYGAMSMYYNVMACLAVAAGFSKPRYWAALYGSLTEAYSLRTFWTRTWHQLIHGFVASIGQFCSRSLGCSPKSTAAWLVRLYVGFIVSSAMHVAGDAMLGRQYIWSSMPFFFAQPIAITFEAAVIAIARQAGYTRCSNWTRTVGYIWVFLWLSVSGPWLINRAVYAGIGRCEILPISPIRIVIRTLESFTGIEVLHK